MTTDTSHSGKLRVVIAGGGVAALETILALAELAPEHTDVLVIAPATEFVYRPMAVREPFAYGPAHHYALAPIIEDAGAPLLADRLAWSTGAHDSRTPRAVSGLHTTRSCWHSEPIL